MGHLDPGCFKTGSSNWNETDITLFDKGSCEKLCRTPEEFKAWSQNLGHEKVLTTYTSYGEIPCQRQGELFIKLVKIQESVQAENSSEDADILKKLRKAGICLSRSK